MGGGGVSKTINKVGNVFDKFVPESVKTINDKLTPEWARSTGNALGLNNQTMMLPNSDDPAIAGEEGITKQDLKDEAAGIASTKVDAKRKAISRSRSVFTSPLGLGGVAGLARKFLLGE